MRNRVLLLVVSSLLACATDSPSQVPAGQWSAPNANLYVRKSGSRLELTCRLADLPATIPLDDTGYFELPATIFEYGIILTSYDAILSGHLNGLSLELHVTAVNDVRPFEQHRLIHKDAPPLPPCG